MICSPYITGGPVKKLIAAVESKGIQDTLAVTVLTNLSISNLMQGATDAGALLLLTERIARVTLVYLPRIHAKVYVSNGSQAIVTSANFTDGGAFANLEYGVQIDDLGRVRAIEQDISHYGQLGSRVEAVRLASLHNQIEPLRQAVQEEQKALSQKLRTLTAELRQNAEDDLLRARVQHRSLNAIFSDTILYLLASNNLSTAELHNKIRDIHPDLCDDTLDRVIDGQHFGKLWKHQVRGAQVTLRRRGLVDYNAKLRLWKAV